MKFTYIAQTRGGKSKIGEISAINLKEAKEKLLERDLILISVDPIKENRFSISFPSRVSHLDKLLFVRHLKMLIKAGLPLREGVAEIKDQTQSRKFKKILDDVLNKLDNGESLSNSLSLHPKVFDDLFVSLIEVGEASGTLEENLGFLADQLEKKHDLRTKLKGAMIYPVVVLGSTLGLVIILAVFILPKLLPLFRSFNTELPLPTKILLFFISAGESYGIYIFASVIFLIFFLIFLSRFRKVKSVFHRIILKLPIFGKLTREVNLAYFSRTLAILIKSGVPIVEAFEITSRSLSNIVYQEEVKGVIPTIKQGGQIAGYFKENPKVFPSVFSRMISIGEKTGNIDESLSYLASFYERDVDEITKNISSTIEPVLLVVMGLAIGFIAISIIMPIYEMTHGLSGLRR